MGYRGYHFFVGDLELPYAPSELTVTMDSKNSTVELISGDEINILKNPKLTDIKFEIELPRGRQYPFANKFVSPITYTQYFEKLMRDRTPTKLVIVRNPPSGLTGGLASGFDSSTWNVTLEGCDLKESAENAYDYTVSLKFKQYVEYGTIEKKVVKQTTASTTTDTEKTTTTVSTPTKTVTESESYTVKKGDCLWTISKKFYGTGTKWKKIYDANKKVIEDTAKKYGRKSSSNGHWIYPNTKLTIPDTK